MLRCPHPRLPDHENGILPRRSLETDHRVYRPRSDQVTLSEHSSPIPGPTGETPSLSRKIPVSDEVEPFRGYFCRSISLQMDVRHTDAASVAGSLAKMYPPLPVERVKAAGSPQ